jgi:preprotein translocase subunit SecG
MTDENPDEVHSTARTARSSSANYHHLTQAEIFAKLTGQPVKAKARVTKRTAPVAPKQSAEKAKLAAQFSKEKAYFQRMANKQKRQHGFGSKTAAAGSGTNKNNNGGASGSGSGSAAAAKSKLLTRVIIGVVVLFFMCGLIVLLNKLDEEDVPDEEKGPLALGMRRAGKRLGAGTGPGGGRSPRSPKGRSPRSKQQHQQQQQRQQSYTTPNQLRPQQQHQTIADSWTMVGEDTDLEFATNFEVSDEVM